MTSNNYLAHSFFRTLHVGGCHDKMEFFEYNFVGNFQASGLTLKQSILTHLFFVIKLIPLAWLCWFVCPSVYHRNRFEEPKVDLEKWLVLIQCGSFRILSKYVQTPWNALSKMSILQKCWINHSITQMFIGFNCCEKKNNKKILSIP